jgi:hypothetical protein
MPPILLLAYLPGSYGNYVGQHLHRHSSNKFKVRHFNPNKQCRYTDLGAKFYHTLDPWLNYTLYQPDSAFYFEKFWHVDHARQVIEQDPDWPVMPTTQYNVVFTHWFQEQYLKHLQYILQCHVVKIVYAAHNVSTIIDRAIPIIKFLKNYENLPDFSQYTSRITDNVGIDTDFDSIEFEKLFEPGYLDEKINSLNERLLLDSGH